MQYYKKILVPIEFVSNSSSSIGRTSFDIDGDGITDIEDIRFDSGDD